MQDMPPKEDSKRTVMASEVLGLNVPEEAARRIIEKIAKARKQVEEAGKSLRRMWGDREGE